MCAISCACTVLDRKTSELLTSFRNTFKRMSLSVVNAKKKM